jgi:hypothetical protein
VPRLVEGNGRFRRPIMPEPCLTGAAGHGQEPRPAVPAAEPSKGPVDAQVRLLDHVSASGSGCTRQASAAGTSPQTPPDVLVRPRDEHLQ